MAWLRKQTSHLFSSINILQSMHIQLAPHKVSLTKTHNRIKMMSSNAPRTNSKPMRRSGTFLLKQSQPMTSPTPKPTFLTPHISTYQPRKSPLVEYPASPQLVVGEEILHFSHPQHPLSEIILPDLFTCVGCKEYGSGKRFSCQQCDFQLHHFCALAPPALFAHPFHCQHQLVFYSKPVKGGIYQSKCDVCVKAVKGFAFRCSACGFQMHPCCGMLPDEFMCPSHPHPLRLLPAAVTVSAGADGNNEFICGQCKRRRSGRVYRCTVCDYHLHVACAKDMVNGLQANGLKGRDKSNMFGAAARVASQAVIEFLGGLIEGIGEGVGQVLVQNIARGRCSTTTRRNRND